MKFQGSAYSFNELSERFASDLALASSNPKRNVEIASTTDSDTIRLSNTSAINEKKEEVQTTVQYRKMPVLMAEYCVSIFLLKPSSSSFFSIPPSEIESAPISFEDEVPIEQSGLLLVQSSLGYLICPVAKLKNDRHSFVI